MFYQLLIKGVFILTTTKYIVKKKSPSPLMLFILLFVFIICSSVFWYFNPSFQQASLDTHDWSLVFQGNTYPKDTFVHHEQVLISLAFVQEQLDGHVFWDEVENTAIITTKDKMIMMNTNELTAYINNNPLDITAPVILIDELPFLPAELLSQIYHLDIAVHNDSKRIVVQEQLVPRAMGVIVKNNATLRHEPTIRSAQLAHLPVDQPVTIYTEKNGYYFVKTAEGLLGYLNKKHVIFNEVQLDKKPHILSTISWPPDDKKINLTWEHVIKKNPDVEQLNPMPGVNVVSPTWFHLKDEQGNLENNADTAYVQWAHQNGYQVWGLITNSFDRNLTHSVLSSTEKRQHVIKQLLVFAQLYNLDGINIDFENMHLADSHLLTQFVRELTPMAHEQGLIVSIDVTIRSTSENWSMIYDRPTLGEIVDYVIVMTYDEHWSSSPKAGSVASLPWVEQGLIGVLQQVPKGKLILGMPFYTRIWEEQMQADGSVKVSSKSLSMTAAEQIIAEKNALITYDEKAQQDYAQWTEGNSTFKIWLENESSITKRVQLSNKYQLAGVASWRRGFEKPVIWDVIQQELFSRP